jgi:membrane-associated protein
MLHLDTHLIEIINATGNWTYVILFAIVFFECGIIFTPFLPGESMLFATGTIAALGVLNIHLVFILLCLAGIIGGFVNFTLGHLLRDHLYKIEKVGFVRRYLGQAHDFYERHGGKTIFIARLIPLIRTYAPFVAGVVRMGKKTFVFYNMMGAIFWVGLFIYGGYFFGNIAFVRRNFPFVILTILTLSLVPAVIAVFKRPKKNNKNYVIHEA